MSYQVFTDACSNLPNRLLEELNIHVLPCGYEMDGASAVYAGDVDGFDFHAFYNKLRNGSELKTSLINMTLFMDHFRPVLEAGEDVVYVGLSSGVSGTLQSARMAAEELMEDFPERTVYVVDSLGAALGPGLLACRAADLRAEGKSAKEAGEILDHEVTHLLQFSPWTT